MQNYQIMPQNNKICTIYSMDLWNNYIGFSSDPNKFYFGRNGGSNWTPGNIYYSI